MGSPESQPSYEQRRSAALQSTLELKNKVDAKIKLVEGNLARVNAEITALEARDDKNVKLNILKKLRDEFKTELELLHRQRKGYLRDVDELGVYRQK